jgi:hypothetical protein
MKRVSVMLVCLCLLAGLVLNIPGTRVSAQTNNLMYSKWNFEGISTEELGTPEHDDDTYYAVGDVSIVEGGAKGTGQALKISGSGDCGNGTYVLGLKSNTEYTFTYWAKIDNQTGDVYPNVGVNSFDGESYVANDSYTTEWERYTLTFKTGENNTMACFYTWVFPGGGSVDLYIDEVTLVEGSAPAEEEPVVEEPEEPVTEEEPVTTDEADNPPTGVAADHIFYLLAVCGLFSIIICFSLSRKMRSQNR